MSASFNFESSRGYNSQPQDEKQETGLQSQSTESDLGMDFAGQVEGEGLAPQDLGQELVEDIRSSRLVRVQDEEEAPDTPAGPTLEDFKILLGQ